MSKNQTRALLIACLLSVATSAHAQSKLLSPSDALKTFKTADDLQIEQVLAEPTIAQPLFLNFDERGRMWVVEYRQYPYPAGLKVVSRDKHWRTVFDKVPVAPPNHTRGKDRITIHEDTNGDGTFDSHKTFVDGLSIVTSVERGRGGVWVLNPPYLLFYPDKNNDDAPDGDPVVHLAGFGLQDTHSVVNSLRWGPDGWLYAAQGSTVAANIVRPGMNDKTPKHSLGQLIWRYHPETRRYEIFAEGGGNAFGVEIDAKGRVYSGHNGGNTRGFHYVQGGYYQKGFSKHGPLSNPYAFGYFSWMAHHNVPRFTHNFVIYEGGALPKQYNGKLLGIEPMQGQLVESEVTADRSSYKTRDLNRPVTSSDKWFRPVDIKVGPNGAIYFCDFNEEWPSHRQHYEGKTFRDTGRIYRVSARGAKPSKAENLGKLTSAELIERLKHKNKWVRQTVLRLLADRKDKSVVPALRKMLSASTGQTALESLWALNLSGGLTEQVALDALKHSDPFVRVWTVRLLCDERKVSPAVAQRLAKMAAVEPHVQVRSQLACSAKRLPAKDALAITAALLARDEDAGDIHLPLLLWWAIEVHCQNDRQAVLALFEQSPLWDRKIVREQILHRLMQRFATAGSRTDLLTCAQLLRLAPHAEAKKQLMRGFEAAFKGRSLARLPEALAREIVAAGGGSLALRIRRGDAAAVREALATVADAKADTLKRRELVQIVGEVKIPGAAPAMLAILSAGSSDDALKMAALTSLQAYDEASIGAEVSRHYAGKLSDDVRAAAETLLASRPTWSRALLGDVEADKLPADAVSMNLLKKILRQNNPANTALIRKRWGKLKGATTAEMKQHIARLKKVIDAAPGVPLAGRALFTQKCAKCHTLFTKGGQIGPDLTAYNRDDVQRILTNVVNPSAEIREGFENYLVLTADGRVLGGLLADQDKQVIVLRGVDGQNIIIERDDIEEMKAVSQSLMPEQLLKGMSEQQVRDLFAYLRIAQPLNY
ncbi:MAG: c-type cytochrome [Planctomycetes bacterium]|nr:c-type cytochrome [Planctomycetota bacterium]